MIASRARRLVRRLTRLARPRKALLGRLPTLAGPLILVVAAILFEWDLVFGGLILADYDVFVLFYPLHDYAAQRLAEGEFPLWNPHAFLGTPLFANPQTAVLYPFNLLFLLTSVPYAYSLNLVLHLALGGCLFFAYCRVSLGVGRIAATLGGLAFSLSGFFAGQAGHLNQVQTAIWLPLLLLLFDLACRRTGLGYLALAICVLAVQLLAGHPQEAYMSLVAIAIHTVCLAVWNPPLVVARAIGTLTALVVLGASLAAIQLVPTLSLTALGIRGDGVAYLDAVSVSLPLSLLPRALLPGYGAQLPNTELIGYVGAIGLALALMALAFSRNRAVLSLTLMVALSLFLAIGDSNPLYPILFEFVPGFGSFRVPARWLFLYTFAVCGLAALGLDLLRANRTVVVPLVAPPAVAAQSGVASANSRASKPEVSVSADPSLVSPLFDLYGFPIARSTLARAALVGLVLGAAAAWQVVGAEPQSRRLMATWVFLGVITAALSVVALRSPWRWQPMVALVVLLGLELWFAVTDLPQRFPVPSFVYGDARPSTVFLQTFPPGGRVLSIAREDYVVKEEPEYRERFEESLSDGALLNLLVATKWNEILMPNVPVQYGLDSVDGYDGGVLPLKAFVQLSGLLVSPDRVRSDGVLLSRLTYVPNPRHLDLLGVRYVLDGKLKDTIVDGVYLDRAFNIRLAPGQSLELRRLPPMSTTRVALLSALDGPDRLTPGGEVGTLQLVDASGASQTIPLRAGWETARAEAGEIASGAALEVVHPSTWTAEGQPEQYLTRLSVDRRAWRSLVVRNTSVQQTLEVKAISLLDDQTRTNEPLILDDRFDRTMFFDMKVYHYLAALPRAYLVHHAVVLDDEAALQAMRSPEYDPRARVLLAPDPAADRMDQATEEGESVRLLGLSPERLAIRVLAKREGWLVVSDAYTPDWIATIDGGEAPVVRANLLLRAVKVPPGDHLLEFHYQPRSLYVGAAITVVAALLTLGIALWNPFLRRAWPGRRRRRTAHW